MTRPTGTERHRNRGWLRHAVLGWTAFLSVFLWTSLNRALWRPELATWSGFGMSGRGPGVWTVVVAICALLVAFLYYLEGHGRRRGLFHGLLLAVHGPLALYLICVVTERGADVAFRGDTWGWELPLWIPLLPVIGFSALSALLVWRERIGLQPPPRPGKTVDRRALLLALALVPAIALTFGTGMEFGMRDRVATGLAVLQWLLIVSGLQATGDRAS